MAESLYMLYKKACVKVSVEPTARPSNQPPTDLRLLLSFCFKDTGLIFESKFAFNTIMSHRAVTVRPAKVQVLSAGYNKTKAAVSSRTTLDIDLCQSTYKLSSGQQQRLIKSSHDPPPAI